jgi:hypothetical protein
LQKLFFFSRFAETGASQDKCSEVYAGPEPFSELCCSVVRDYTTNLNADGSVLGYFTIHSYAQMWLSPWGWTEELPPTYDDLASLLISFSS